ncbi:L,D-transpeptidase family protein [Pseudobacillus sp. FSL P4-0506]|uniref:L,D-transpeptidase family protein n=1 Tax=unclassified Pseudobacillus TaxID=2619284 RepID=UPI0030FC836F
MKKIFVSTLFIFCAAFLSPSFSTAAETASFEKKVAAQLSAITDSSQFIVVEGKTNHYQAVLRTYEKRGDTWVQTYKTAAVIGKNGLSQSKREGDGRTPVGLFPIGEGFGFAPKPANLNIRYTQTNNYHYWIDDPSSPDYNQWIYYRGNPNKRWKSYERLNHFLYKYAVIIKYNEKPIITGKGSAIFLHRWRQSTSPTAGCVALNENHLLNVMRWIVPAKQPKIVIGDQSSIVTQLKNYKNSAK